MSIATFEGVVEQGQIRLKNNVRLPENTRVFVVVPEVQVEKVARIVSPRRAHREDATDFEMEITRE
jgi:hypothetical protein